MKCFEHERQTPKGEIEAGKEILHYIWFSFHWPVQLKFYRKVQVPISRWWFKRIYLPVNRIFDAYYFWRL